jgi:hypothetical protein
MNRTECLVAVVAAAGNHSTTNAATPPITVGAATSTPWSSGCRTDCVVIARLPMALAVGQARLTVL